MALPDFGRSVNPISSKGDRLCSTYDTGTFEFSDLPIVLNFMKKEAQAILDDLQLSGFFFLQKKHR